HFSLLLACMLPLSLTPPAFLSCSHSPIQACHVAPFAGLLSVGIGDTMHQTLRLVPPPGAHGSERGGVCLLCAAGGVHSPARQRLHPPPALRPL
ncbi:unnamed protein product, partial [Closterium sp. Naga37s-1]